MGQTSRLQRAAVAVLFLPALAAATTVTLISPRTVPITNPGATLDLLAYSEFTDSTTGVTSKNTVATDPVVNGASIRPLTDKVVIPRAGLSPVIGFTGLTPKPAANRVVNSCSSGCFSGIDGRITYVPPNATAPNGQLDASAAHRIERPGVGAGFSAVRGVDPDVLSPGDYSLHMVITQLTLDVSPGEFGYAALFATDSRFTTPLWSLEVTVVGSSSPDVVFSSQSLLGLDNGAVGSRVKRDLVKAGGTLTNYPLFDALYPVPLSPTITYGEGLVAIAGAVPEPAAWALGLAGLGLIAAVVAMRRRAGTRAAMLALAGLTAALAPPAPALAAVVYTDGRNPQGVPDITQTDSPIANGGICAAAATANILWNWSEFAPYDASLGGRRLVAHPGDANWPAGFAAWSADSLSLRNTLVTQIYGTGNNGYGTAGGITRYVKSRGHLYDSGFFGLGANSDGLSVRTYNGNAATYANLYNSLYNGDGSLKFAHATTSWVWHNPDGSFVNSNNAKSRHALAVAGMDVPGNNDPGHRQIVLTNGWGSQQERPDPVSTDYYDTYTNIVRTRADRLRIPAGVGDNNDGNGNDYLVHGIPAAANSDYVEMYQFVVVKKGGSPDVGLGVQPLAGGINQFDYKVHNPEPTAQFHFFVELDPAVRSLLSLSQITVPQGWAVENWNPAGTITTPETANWNGSELFAPGVATQGSTENYAFTPGWDGLHFYWTGASGAPIGTGEVANFQFDLPGTVGYTPAKRYLSVVGEYDQTVHYYNMIGGPTLVPELPPALLFGVGLLPLGSALRRRAGKGLPTAPRASLSRRS